MENENLKEKKLETIEENEETIKNSNEEILVDNKEKVEEGKTLIFLKRLLAGIIDQVIAIAIAIILFLLFNAVLKVFGLYFVEREQIFFILYVITNILYMPICKSSKLKKTIGLKINFK